MTKNDPFKARVRGRIVGKAGAQKERRECKEGVTAFSKCVSPSSASLCRCHLAMYPHQLPLRLFPSLIPSLSLGAQHPCLLGRPLLAPSHHLSRRPSLRSSSMSSLRPSPRSSPSLCLPLMHKPEVPFLRLHLQHPSLLQWLPSLLPWLPSSARVPPVDLGHSPIKKRCLWKLPLLWAQGPLSPQASPMLSRKRSP